MSTAATAAVLEQLLDDLEVSQWEPAARLEAMQHRQLVRLAEFSAAHSPFFGERMRRAGLRPADLADPDAFARVPLLTRRDIQSAGDRLFCRDLPAEHAQQHLSRTSGSTGEPVVVRRTAVTTLFWRAMGLRDFRWHGDDFSWRACVIRPGIDTPTEQASWGSPASLIGTTGRMLGLPITAPAARLASWIREFEPASILVYPNTLLALATHCADEGCGLTSLRQIRTISETLSRSTRELAEQVFGVSVVDTYSSQELGYIALQCPRGDVYHTMSETVLAEVLDGNGEPCGPGEVGRVVVTDLHNFATPLIRYAIGDLAEVAPSCACGRGLPAWRRIVGRERNLIRLPDGSRHWPLFGLRDCREVAPVRQFQLVQRSFDSVELKLVVERSLTIDEERALCARVSAQLGPFTVTPVYVDDRIAAGANGKFEEFVCAV